MHRSTIRVYVLAPRSGDDRFRLRWHQPDDPPNYFRQQLTEHTTKRAAEKQAAQFEADLNAGRYVHRERISWADFRDRLEREKLSSLAKNTRASYAVALNSLEKTMRWQFLADASAGALSTYQSKLRGNVEEATIAAYLRHIVAALNWAASVGLCDKPGPVARPQRAKSGTQMRGRPLAVEEFERMLGSCFVLRPDDAGDWQDFLTGLWLSGLRLTESLVVSWDDDAELAIYLGRKRPALRIWSEGEKGFTDRLLPLTPDFAEWLLRLPKRLRKGPVFAVSRYGMVHVSETVGAIGEHARVVTNAAKNEFASAHDLRRSFGTRWAGRVMPATLKTLMRHEDIATTMKFYVAQEADALATELWRHRDSVIMQLPVSPPRQAESCDKPCDSAKTRPAKIGRKARKLQA